MYEVYLDEALKRRAEEMEKDTLKHLPNRPNYTDFCAQHRYYHGYLGELGFEKFLINKEKKFYYNPKTNGHSDNGDFRVYTNTGFYIIDVKTSSTATTFRNVFVLDKQYQKFTHIDIYVGIKLVDDFAQIMGFCYKDELYMDYEKDAMICSYDRLTDIDNLLQRLI